MPYLNNEVKYIRDQFDTAFNEDSQVGLSPSFINKIRKTSFEQTTTRTKYKNLTIWEIVFHIIVWMKAALNTLQTGKLVDPAEISSWPKLEIHEENWEKMKLELEVVLNAIFEELDSWNNQSLHTIINGTDYDYNSMLKGALHHIMFHMDKISNIS